MRLHTFHSNNRISTESVKIHFSTESERRKDPCFPTPVIHSQLLTEPPCSNVALILAKANGVICHKGNGSANESAPFLFV